MRRQRGVKDTSIPLNLARSGILNARCLHSAMTIPRTSNGIYDCESAPANFA